MRCVSPIPTTDDNISEELAGNPPEPVPRAAQTDPKLSSTLQADYEALRNDVQQANEMAADFQRELAGKSNEVAHFKQVFEKTRHDLAQLQVGITDLRLERHRLANEAMRAVGLERTLATITSERDRLKSDVDTMRQAMESEAESKTRRPQERDVQIGHLKMEIATLKGELARRGGNTEPAPIVDADLPEVHSTLKNIASSVDWLMARFDPKTLAAQKKRSHDRV